jgi:Zn-dependent peptidase ImmA (M78 family)
LTLKSFYQFAEESNIPVIPFPLGDLGAMSYMDNKGRSYIGIDPERIASEQDEKMKLSHELGHATQGAYYNRYATCDVWKRQENKADRWAFEHLVSKKEIHEAIKHGYVENWQLAELFDVPPETMARICHYYKYGNMDVIT